MATAMNYGTETSSTLLAAMAEGIGETVFLAANWVETAQEVLAEEADRRSEQLGNSGSFTLCEVAVNPPAYLKCGGRLAWNVRFDGPNVSVATGEIPASECDLKITGDHSIMSNVARIQYQNRDPRVVAAAQARLHRVGRWEIEGTMPQDPSLMQVLRTLHDAMAPKTMPRFVWMSPEWVTCTRAIVTNRAISEKYRNDLIDVEYTFSEEFVNPPKYAFPDRATAGFWVRCERGSVTVGYGALPDHLQPADFQNRGEYTPVVPVGRTVESAMSESDRKEQQNYLRQAFRYDADKGETPVFEQTHKSGKPNMPPALGRVMMVLHDELSKRSSGELPCDYEDVPEKWRGQPNFDRENQYDPTWLNYDKYDIYGNPKTS